MSRIHRCAALVAVLALALPVPDASAQGCAVPGQAGEDIRETFDPAVSTHVSLAWNGSGYGMAWYDQRTGPAIYFAALDDQGAKTIDDLEVTQSAVANPSLAWGAGQYGLAWADRRDGNDEIYFARLGFAGNKLGDDVRLTNDIAKSFLPSLEWTGSEFGVAWRDHRDGNDEIYFARLDAGGTKIGGDVRVTNDAASSSLPSLAATGSGYGVAWHDDRDGNLEIYFALLDATGAKIGSDVRVTSNAAISLVPSLVWTGSEFGVAWYDFRDGNYEIYFARLDASGNKIGGDVRVTQECSACSFPSPTDVEFDCDACSTSTSAVPSLTWIGGQFGVAWYDLRGGSLRIWFARLDAAGNKLLVSTCDRHGSGTCDGGGSGTCDGGGSGIALGQPCADTGDCVALAGSGATCIGGALGQPCDRDLDCAAIAGNDATCIGAALGQPCADRASCEALAGAAPRCVQTCDAGGDASALGLPCTDGTDCVAIAGQGSFCFTVGACDGGGTGTCDDGGDGSADGQDCTSDASCIQTAGAGATCVGLGLALGLPCTSTSQCVEVARAGAQCLGAGRGTCDGGGSGAGLGQVCSTSVDCEAYAGEGVACQLGTCDGGGSGNAAAGEACATTSDCEELAGPGALCRVPDYPIADADAVSAIGPSLVWSGVDFAVGWYEARDGNQEIYFDRLRCDCTDADGDAFTTCEDDCNDADAQILPGALERCNAADDNCDGVLPADELDADADTFISCSDNCPAQYNPGQADWDNDSIGNSCDICVFDADPLQFDTDADQYGDACDNCAEISNTSQADGDADSVGDVCDNCPVAPNSGQADIDGDGRGDACDVCPADFDPNPTDADGDGVSDACDNCPDDVNASQANLDGADFAEVRSITTTANGAESAAAGDLDGDGDPDVVSTSSIDNTVAWYPNLDGLGTFGTRLVISNAFTAVARVTAGDIDADGDIDVVAASVSGANRVTRWYPNDGSGSFGSPFSISTGSIAGLAGVSLLDMDKDNIVDFLVAGNIAVWYRRTNNTSYQTKQIAFVSGSSVTAIAGGDLDGDGDNDAVVAFSPTNRVVWYENVDGFGASFAVRTDLTAAALAARAVFIADLNKDGDRDVLVASENDDTISWFENLGAGTFGPEQQLSASADAARDVLASDLDLDGDLDVLAASANDDTIMWFQNLDGAGTFGPKRQISTAADGARSVFAADLDGDTDPDVLSASFLDDKVAWYPNAGDSLGDVCDNCPSNANPGQEDVVHAGNGVGDLCDNPDGDSITDAFDNCPFLANEDQADLDADDSGDPCDNCVSEYNPFQTDFDLDGLGDVCDNCPFDVAPQTDVDGDRVGDACDNCPNDFDPTRTDSDQDTLGDVCDNCPFIVNLAQDDGDADGVGDPCDNCPLVFNPDQTDSNGNFIGDACDFSDGLIYVQMRDSGLVVWQDEVGFDSWNYYRGDLDVLKSTGVYVQVPGSNALAEADCGVGQTSMLDQDQPAPGKVAFIVVTGVNGQGEGGLGHNSAGVPRPGGGLCP